MVGFEMSDGADGDGQQHKCALRLKDATEAEKSSARSLGSNCDVDALIGGAKFELMQAGSDLEPNKTNDDVPKPTKEQALAMVHDALEAEEWSDPSKQVWHEWFDWTTKHKGVRPEWLMSELNDIGGTLNNIVNPTVDQREGGRHSPVSMSVSRNQLNSTTVEYYYYMELNRTDADFVENALTVKDGKESKTVIRLGPFNFNETSSPSEQREENQPDASYAMPKTKPINGRSGF